MLEKQPSMVLGFKQAISNAVVPIIYVIRADGVKSIEVTTGQVLC